MTGARFGDRVALVTGAASGIGLATAALLRDEGATVVGVDVREGADEVVDVTDTVAVDAAVAAVVGRHGRLDVVANVAGIPQFGAVEQLGDEEWARQLDVNLSGPFRVCRAAVPHLRATRGCIVNVASVAGVQGQPFTAAYSASKGGLVLLTKSLAVELSVDGIRVNCVCPAAVDTPLLGDVAGRIPADVDLKLFGRLDMLLPGLVSAGEVAEAIAYLASPAARMVSGACIVLDGARSA